MMRLPFLAGILALGVIMDVAAAPPGPDASDALGADGLDTASPSTATAAPPSGRGPLKRKRESREVVYPGDGPLAISVDPSITLSYWKRADELGLDVTSMLREASPSVDCIARPG